MNQVTNNFPKLHNAMWPGLVGKGSPGAEPPIDLDTMLELTAKAEVDGVPAAFGVMALAGDALDRAAALSGVTLDQAKFDASSNIRAGAALLDAYATELGIDRADLAAWKAPLEKLTGIDDAVLAEAFIRDDVFARRDSPLRPREGEAYYTNEYVPKSHIPHVKPGPDSF